MAEEQAQNCLAAAIAGAAASSAGADYDFREAPRFNGEFIPELPCGAGFLPNERLW